MEKITDLLDGLRKVDPRLSKADFSRTYLNRNRTYLNYLEATGLKAPSAVWLCAYKGSEMCYRAYWGGEKRNV